MWDLNSLKCSTVRLMELATVNHSASFTYSSVLKCATVTCRRSTPTCFCLHGDQSDPPETSFYHIIPRECISSNCRWNQMNKVCYTFLCRRGFYHAVSTNLLVSTESTDMLSPLSIRITRTSCWQVGFGKHLNLLYYKMLKETAFSSVWFHYIKFSITMFGLL